MAAGAPQLSHDAVPMAVAELLYICLHECPNDMWLKNIVNKHVPPLLMDCSEYVAMQIICHKPTTQVS
jgi:hypothetical protein